MHREKSPWSFMKGKLATSCSKCSLAVIYGWSRYSFGGAIGDSVLRLYMRRLCWLYQKYSIWHIQIRLVSRYSIGASVLKVGNNKLDIDTPVGLLLVTKAENHWFWDLFVSCGHQNWHPNLSVTQVESSVSQPNVMNTRVQRWRLMLAITPCKKEMKGFK